MQITSKADIRRFVEEMAEGFEYFHEGRDVMASDSIRDAVLSELTSDLWLGGPTTRDAWDWKSHLGTSCTVDELSRIVADYLEGRAE
jgi:hypothetical protein